MPDVVFHEWVFRLREKGWHEPVRGWRLIWAQADFWAHPPPHLLTLTLRFEPRRGVTA